MAFRYFFHFQLPWDILYDLICDPHLASRLTERCKLKLGAITHLPAFEHKLCIPLDSTLSHCSIQH